MRKTLIELVQSMLRAIDSEQVTSVGSTEESAMCVDIANQAYAEMITEKRWKHLRQLNILTPDTELNVLNTPANTIYLDYQNVYYDGTRVTYKTPEDFLRLVESRDTSDSNVTEYANIKVITNQNPTYWTSFDDISLTFDSIPDTINGLDASKSKAIVYRVPSDMLTADGEYFDLPEIAFPTLQILCNAYAKQELKGDDGGYDRDFNMFRRKMASLSRNSRLIDPDPTINTHRIVRPTMGRRGGTINITEV